MNKIALLNLNDRDKRMIKKFTGAGLGIGAGSALLLSLAGYLQQLKADATNDTSKDDDTLTIRMPGMQPKMAGVGPGIAMAGLGLGAVTSAVLTRKIMQAIKQRDLQRQLDEAQQVWLTGLTPQRPEQPKEASVGGKPVAMSELLLSSPVALALLMAAGSGTLAYSALDKQFGDKPKPKSPAPKRVRFSYEDPQTQQPKEASLSLDIGFETAARMALAAAPRSSDFSNVVGAICDGRLDELRHNFQSVGPDQALDLVKGASVGYDSAPEPLRGLAIASAMHDPLIGETMRLHAISELVEAYPAIMAKAAFFAGEDAGPLRNQLMTFTAVIGATAREDSQAALEAGFEVTPAQEQTYGELLQHLDAAA